MKNCRPMIAYPVNHKTQTIVENALREAGIIQSVGPGHPLVRKNCKPLLQAAMFEWLLNAPRKSLPAPEPAE